MLERLVKMEFQPEEVANFLLLFEQSAPSIRAMAGCNYLALLQDQQNPNCFFTYSRWESAQHLDNYRTSDFFKATWAKSKILFSRPAEAWSLTAFKVIS